MFIFRIQFIYKSKRVEAFEKINFKCFYSLALINELDSEEGLHHFLVNFLEHKASYFSKEKNIESFLKENIHFIQQQ